MNEATSLVRLLANMGADSSLKKDLKKALRSFEFDALMKATDAAQTFLKTGGWVSVEDRLPETCNPVLAHCSGKGGGTFVARLEGSKWVLDADEDLTMFVTHWQPLPEGPR